MSATPSFLPIPEPLPGTALLSASASGSAASINVDAIVTKLRAAGCVFAEDEAQLLISAASTSAELATMVERRAAGLPIEHVVGGAEFCGHRITVDPGVFVPRYRTQFLAAEAIALARPRAVVVDLCCGSGALGAAVAAAHEQIELHAADIDPAAVHCARRNLQGGGGTVYEGDLFEPLPAALRGRIDILVANVPYVPTDQIALLPAEARVHEALVALDGGTDGLDLLRRVTATAPTWLVPGGHLLFETSEQQAQRAVEAVISSGLIPRIASSEELDATVIIGTRPN